MVPERTDPLDCYDLPVTEITSLDSLCVCVCVLIPQPWTQQLNSSQMKQHREY